jgi:hypothetical protein
MSTKNLICWFPLGADQMFGIDLASIVALSLAKSEPRWRLCKGTSTISVSPMNKSFTSIGAIRILMPLYDDHFQLKCRVATTVSKSACYE